ncbi:hypothetical protein BANRA_05462 [Klebsiella pneumoniae]|nr:hypothetical protein BANRA_05462 [Klebsiella pneumoniae]
MTMQAINDVIPAGSGRYLSAPAVIDGTTAVAFRKDLADKIWQLTARDFQCLPAASKA